MGAEFVVVIGMIWATRLVASEDWIAANQSWPTTLWATNAPISAAILAARSSGWAPALR